MRREKLHAGCRITFLPHPICRCVGCNFYKFDLASGGIEEVLGGREKNGGFYPGLRQSRATIVRGRGQLLHEGYSKRVFVTGV